jgi:hypothetical protein
MQLGGQVHLWDPPEFAIKKDAIWNPANEGFATFFARMAIIWENYEQAKRVTFLTTATGSLRHSTNFNIYVTLSKLLDSNASV